MSLKVVKLSSCDTCSLLICYFVVLDDIKFSNVTLTIFELKEKFIVQFYILQLVF